MRNPQEKGLGPEDDGGTLTASAFSAHNSNQEGPRHLCGLQMHSPQMPGGFGGCLEAPAGQEERPPSLEAHSSAPTWLKLFSWGLSPYPRSSFLPCLWGRGTVLTKVLGSSNLGINWILQEDVSESLLYSPCTELGLCTFQFGKHVVMQYMDLIRTTSGEMTRAFSQDLPTAMKAVGR